MGEAIVGAWRTTVTIPGGAPFVNLTTFLSGGIVLNAFPTPSPAPPGASHKLEFFTTAVGSWAAGAHDTVSMAFETLGVDENGTALGSHVISATVTVAADGAGWSGPFTLAVLDPSGKQTASVSGSVSGARIAPN